jgi:hypothetical protein
MCVILASMPIPFHLNFGLYLIHLPHIFLENAIVDAQVYRITLRFDSSPLGVYRRLITSNILSKAGTSNSSIL